MSRAGFDLPTRGDRPIPPRADAPPRSVRPAHAAASPAKPRRTERRWLAFLALVLLTLPAGPLGATERLDKLIDVAVALLAGWGYLIFDTPSVGCQNQLVNPGALGAQQGGIGVFRSGVCIFGGVLANQRTGI